MHRLLAALVVFSMASMPAVAQSSRKKSKPKQQQQLEPPPPPAPVPATPAAPTAQPAPPLPSTQPALPASKPKGAGTTLGLYRLVRKGETDPLLKAVDDAFRLVADASRRYQSVVPLPEPAEKQGCGLNVPCLASLGGLQGVDEVFAGDLTKTENGLILRVKLVDTRGERVLGDKDQVIASQTASEVQVWAESLGCKLLMGQECIGEVLVDADLPEIKILVDGEPISRTSSRPERLRLPVGVHRVRIAVDKRTSLERPLLVSRQPSPGVTLYAREHEEALALMSPAEAPRGIDGKPSVAPSVRPTPTKWTRNVGMTMAAVGVVAAGIATYEGLHSKSLANDANSRYAANGAYTQQDLATISSAHSAANAANILFIVGGALAASGLVLTFAF
ncbi:MAG TPA: hypothetical protein VKB92_10600 [Myxococcales bacterium]|nr:hypothetical protein [Myxococcales bacterium]